MSSAIEFDEDILSNSKVQLTELTVGGDYNTRIITFLARSGETSLEINEDGSESSNPIPKEKFEELIKFLFSQDCETLPDLTGNSFPDVSKFILMISIGEQSNMFEVEGVDFVMDPRYKEIVKEIIKKAEELKSDNQD